MKVKNMTAGTLVRTVTLVVALLNLVLTSFGKNPLPFSDEQIYTGLSALVTVAAALAAWWSALKKRMALAMAASCFSPELIFLSLLSFAAAAVTEPRKGCYLL